MMKPLPFEAFEANTGIRHSDLFRGWDDAQSVVSLREVGSVRGLLVMPRPYLCQLLRKVTIVGSVYPYENAHFETVRIDPKMLTIGQTFIQRSKYQALLEDFPALFDEFSINTGAKCTALIVYGETEDGTRVISHYLPPIIEEHESLCLLDGIHRNFVVMRVGTTLETIVVRGVKEAFPCTPQPWSSVKVVERKPPVMDRYFNLNPGLFRNLEQVGIDG
jgi:hypothetical protein